MSTEVLVLTLAALWQGFQYVLVSVPANRELGPSVTMGPRDDGPLEDRVRPETARLARALANHFEALTLFTVAVVAVELSGAGSALTAGLAWLYLAARVAYVPAYRIGRGPWRSLIWLAGFSATMLMLATAFIVNIFGLAPG